MSASSIIDQLVIRGVTTYVHEGDKATILEALLRGLEIRGHADAVTHGYLLSGLGDRGWGRGSGSAPGDGEGPGREGSCDGSVWLAPAVGHGRGDGSGDGGEWKVISLACGWTVIESLDGR